jgi:hypothetical protein
MVETIQHQWWSFLGLLVLPLFRVIAGGMMLNLELSHQELFHKWWSWEEKIAVVSTSDAPEGIAFVSWDALVRSEREQLRRLLRSSNVFVISTASAIAMCKIELFPRPQKQNQPQLHHHMEKREVDQDELATTCLCAPAIPFYPSTTFAVHFTSS